MKNNKNISEVKDDVLVDAISAIDIVGVDVKSRDEGNTALYITTNDISSVDKDKLSEICEKNSSKKFEVKFLIPENKFVVDKFIPNTDCVCIFITEQ